MKNTIKILLLILAISLAIGGIMVYAKTKVDPPKALKQIDQYSIDISTNRNALAKVKDISKEDSIFRTVIDRIYVYQMEDKLNTDASNKCLDEFTSTYCPLFLDRCFTVFNNSVWFESDHKMILNRISLLKAISHDDKSTVLTGSTIDSLNLVSGVISDYRQARRIAITLTFSGVSSAKSIIAQADKFSENIYLKNCTDLITSLKSVKPSIASSHYNYVLSQVEKLSQYRYYSKLYYESSLIPYVDAVTTEYDEQAQKLYGSKRDVNALWQKARTYYDQAMIYYGAENI